MKQKKFNRKIRNADRRELEKMYLEHLEAEPGSRRREQLDALASMMDWDSVGDMNFSFYGCLSESFDRIRYQTLTGYGQCEGMLICRGNDVVICCCRDMASLVAFRHAHYSNGRIYAPGDGPEEICEKGERYIIDGTKRKVFRRCPFCGAPVYERNLDCGTEDAE